MTALPWECKVLPPMLEYSGAQSLSNPSSDPVLLEEGSNSLALPPVLSVNSHIPEKRLILCCGFQLRLGKTSAWLF